MTPSPSTSTSDIRLAQAVLKDVSFFEVALRNAYDRAISSTWSRSDHWLFDDASPVRRPILRTNKRGQVNDANRLNRNSIDHLRNGLREDATAAMNAICGFRSSIRHGQRGQTETTSMDG